MSEFVGYIAVCLFWATVENGGPMKAELYPQQPYVHMIHTRPFNY